MKIIIALLALAALTGCCDEKRYVRPEDQESAAALYKHIYEKSVYEKTSTVYAAEQAQRAVLTVYGQPYQPQVEKK